MILKIDPIPCPRLTYQGRNSDRAKRYHKYCNDLKYLYGSRKLDGNFKVKFTIKIPKSWSNKKKEIMNHQAHRQTPDLDNLVKGVLDALCKNDGYIYEINASKVWGYEGSIEVL